MTPEELLRPRYKVIADFPQGAFRFKVGEILEKKGIHFTGEAKSINENEINKYPHLFHKLEWWEERQEDEMPEYIRYEDEKIYKVLHWEGATAIIKLRPPDYKLKATMGFGEYLPSTKEEFEKQNKEAI